MSGATRRLLSERGAYEGKKPPPWAEQILTGKAIQRSLEDQMRERDRRVQRVADRVREPAVALESPGQVRRALWMDEDEHAELLGLGPERVEHRIGKFVAGDARADGGATQPQL